MTRFVYPLHPIFIALVMVQQVLECKALGLLPTVAQHLYQHLAMGVFSGAKSIGATSSLVT